MSAIVSRGRPSRAGRDPSSVRLVAVSKTFSADHVRAAADCGQIDFGENKLQEALPKMDATADLPLTWHLIGHLQSNKAKKAGARFDFVHSVDSAAIAGPARRGRWRGGPDDPSCSSRWTSRASRPSTAPTRTSSRPSSTRRGSLHAARFVGLMILPPASDDPEHARPYFRALRELRDELRLARCGRVHAARAVHGHERRFRGRRRGGRNPHPRRNRHLWEPHLCLTQRCRHKSLTPISRIAREGPERA